MFWHFSFHSSSFVWWDTTRIADEDSGKINSLLLLGIRRGRKHRPGQSNTQFSWLRLFNQLGEKAGGFITSRSRCIRKPTHVELVNYTDIQASNAIIPGLDVSLLSCLITRARGGMTVTDSCSTDPSQCAGPHSYRVSAVCTLSVCSGKSNNRSKNNHIWLAYFPSVEVGNAGGKPQKDLAGKAAVYRILIKGWAKWREDVKRELEVQERIRLCVYFNLDTNGSFAFLFVFVPFLRGGFWNRLWRFCMQLCGFRKITVLSKFKPSLVLSLSTWSLLSTLCPHL